MTVINYISVVIPLYNNETYIQEAINSALFHRVVGEVVVVDDCSSDKSVLQVKKLSDPRIKLIELKENRGVSHARNVGVSFSTGRFIAFLDSDDYFLKNRFCEDMKLIQQEEVDIVYNALGSFNEKTKKENELITTLSKNYPPETLLDVFTGIIKEPGHLSLDTMTFKRYCFSKYSFNPSLFLGEDTELIIKMASRYKMHAGELKTPVAIRRIHTKNNSSIRHSQFYSQRERLYFSLINEIGEDIPLKNLNLIRSHYYKFYNIRKTNIQKFYSYFAAMLQTPQIILCKKFHYENFLIHIPLMKKLKQVLSP